ncbi:MAG TPA: glycosyltransferase family 4 protein [Thermoanaerobaculia bacterium]|jgi:glycosyltransferase involved in cell wall biosynthesis
MSATSDVPREAPLSVAYLLDSTELFGGVKVVLLQAEALARRGHRVTVVSPDAPPDWFPLMRARFERSAFSDSAALADAQVRVATFWETVSPALAGARGPVFHLCQGYEGEITWYRDRWKAIEEVYRAPTHKLAISATLAERLARLGFGPVADVGQAFDREGFFPAPVRSASDPPEVLVVGPLEIDFKGVAIALEGLALWRRLGARFRLRRVSYFPCPEAERRGGLADEYHHRVPPERMPFAYRAADLFIGASRVEEGFGLPSLEALACGVPALLSDVPGQREIGADAAWYFEDGDPESLARALPLLLSEDARARAREAGPAAAARFDSSRVARRLEEEFRRALREEPPR